MLFYEKKIKRATQKVFVRPSKETIAKSIKAWSKLLVLCHLKKHLLVFLILCYLKTHFFR